MEYGYHLKPLRDASIDELSESDVVCLEQIIQSFGHYPSWHLVELSHDDAWKGIWEHATTGSDPIPVEKIIETFEDDGELLDYLQNMHNDEVMIALS